MSVMRTVLLAMSTSPFLREQATKRAFVRKSVSAFMPGEQVEDALTAAAALNNLANHYVSAQSWDEAVVAFQEALELARGAGATEYEVDNLGGLGEVYAALGDLEQAAEAHTLALAAARAVGYREGECDALLNLGRDHLAAGRTVTWS